MKIVKRICKICGKEFDGDYWHGKVGNKKREEKRNIDISSQGFEIFHVKEYDYKVDENNILEECIKFLGI